MYTLHLNIKKHKFVYFTLKFNQDADLIFSWKRNHVKTYFLFLDTQLKMAKGRRMKTQIARR